MVIVTENGFLCDVNSDSDGQQLCLSLGVIASVIVIPAVTDSDLAYHWVWLLFNSDIGGERQWLWLSLRVISAVMVILTVTDSDCVCH